MSVSRALIATAVLIATCQSAPGANAPAYKIAYFTAEVTIPLGHRCMGILLAKAKTIDDPLEAHGFILLGPPRPLVLVAID